MRRQQGFTYLGLIILVTVIGLVGAASLKVGALLQRAAAEEELLEIGAQFSAALKSYAAATPQGQPQQPKTLKDLLRDPRSPAVKRHLRKIFVDPVTGKAEWGVMYLGDKVGVIGVYSLSQAQPLKISNFDGRFTNLENKKKISDWKFMMPGQAAALPVPGQPGQPGHPGQPGQSSLFGQNRPGMPAAVTGAAPEAAPDAPANGESRTVTVRSNDARAVEAAPPEAPAQPEPAASPEPAEKTDTPEKTEKTEEKTEEKPEEPEAVKN